MRVYGTNNCVKTLKAREWFKENDIDFEFYDIRKNGISLEKIFEWDERVGYENFLNKHVRTWSMLYPKEREMTDTRENAILLMYKKLGIIKRPIIETENMVYFGFDEGQYRLAFIPDTRIAKDKGNIRPPSTMDSDL